MSTLAIIQARLGSKRWPRKVLEKMPDRRPMIAHVVERVRLIQAVNRIIVAVPHGQEQVLFCGVHTYGPLVPENDVLSRYALAAQLDQDATDIIRITGDCPLLQPDICDRLIENWRASGCEYGWIDTASGLWPDGLDCEVFTRDLLMQAHMQATEAYDREHVTPIMRRMRVPYSLPADPAFADWPKLSIDTPQDLERVRQWGQTRIGASAW